MKSNRLETVGVGVLYAAYVVAILTGILLAFTYRHDSATATTAIIRTSPVLRLGVNAHYWSSFLSLVLGGLLIGKIAFSGANRAPGTFYTVLALTGAALLAQITGNALPADAHDLRTVAVEVGIAERVPIVGSIAADAMRGGPEPGDSALLRWYIVHTLMLFALVVPTAFRRLQKDEEPAPDWAVGGVIAVGVLVAASFVEGPRGAAGTDLDWQNFAARPSYYTWPLHGALRVAQMAGSGMDWLGTVLLPGLFTGFLLILPRLRNQAIAKGGFGLFCLLWLGLAVTFGGVPAPISGSQDVASELPPSGRTKASPVDLTLVAAGKKLFSEVGCAGCHTMDGNKGSGGPNLTSSYERHSDPQWYVRYIKKPTDVVPTSTMPAFGRLPQRDLSALAEYLRATPAERLR